MSEGDIILQEKSDKTLWSEIIFCKWNFHALTKYKLLASQDIVENFIDIQIRANPLLQIHLSGRQSTGQIEYNLW